MRGGEAEWEALARYLAGESPPDEADAVRRALDADPARRALVGAVGRVSAAVPADVDVETALRRVHARMDEEADPRVIPLRPRQRPATVPFWRSPSFRAAAVLVFLLVGGYALWRAVAGERVPARAYATAVGERDSVVLADGSRVILGPESRLTVAAGYGRRAREVELSGEAFFDVPHDDARPFTVRAGPARVRDLGTSFTVRTGGGEGVRVVVTAGSVVLQPAEESADSGVVLRQGDRGALDPAGRVSAERAAATDEDLAWTRGRLVFRAAPLEEVAAELRRWYGVELRPDAALAGRRLTASFEGEPREEILRVVALALGAEVETRGDTAVLRAAR